MNFQKFEDRRLHNSPARASVEQGKVTRTRDGKGMMTVCGKRTAQSVGCAGLTGWRDIIPLAFYGEQGGVFDGAEINAFALK